FLAWAATFWLLLRRRVGPAPARPRAVVVFFWARGEIRDGLPALPLPVRVPRLGLRAPFSSSLRWVSHKSFRQLASPIRRVTVRAGSAPHTSHTTTVFSATMPPRLRWVRRAYRSGGEDAGSPWG